MVSRNAKYPAPPMDHIRSAAGGDRKEAWDRETMFSQLAKRSSQNVDSGVRHNKYFRSTINLFEIVCKIYVYFVGGK